MLDQGQQDVTWEKNNYAPTVTSYLLTWLMTLISAFNTVKIDNGVLFSSLACLEHSLVVNYRAKRKHQTGA